MSKENNNNNKDENSVAVVRSEAQKQRNQSEIDFENEIYCGIGSWRPQFMQRFATAKWFLIIFSLLAVLQGALFTYLVGIMSTLEKRFAFEAKVSGLILITDNLSQMVLSPVIGFLGSRYNRSRLIASGELVVALSCFMAAIPYFTDGPGLHLLNKQTVNGTQYQMCTDHPDDKCTAAEIATESKLSLFTFPVIILLVSNFANGLGYTAFYTIGLPYLDDNIEKKNSPIYLSTISTIRLLGPTLGFVLSSLCLKLYEDPSIDPGITNQDPRWIGAWWLGFIILGTLIFIFTIPMFMFPKVFKALDKPKTASKRKESTISIKLSKLKDLKLSFKRLLGNYLLIFHTVGGVFRVIGYLGYYINKPKYMEIQYRKSSSSASMYTGITSIVTMAVGTMTGGYFIRYFKPSARNIAIYIVTVELFAASSILSAYFLPCETPTFNHLDLINPPPGIDIQNTCLKGCDCSTEVYQPICGSDGHTNYFSPCYAGCVNQVETDNQLSFYNCSCIASDISATKNYATNHLCPRDCNRFWYFISILSAGNMVASTARTGDTLLTLRCVEPRDKSFAMGVIGSIFAIFAFIPYPLIFGTIIDSTCKVWEITCGRSGNCWLYDIDKLRKYLHFSSFGFIMFGITMEIGCVVFADRVRNMYDDDEQTDTQLETVKKRSNSAYSTDAKLPKSTQEMYPDETKKQEP